MSLSGRERRILAEIERALERDDPELARRVAAINRVETGGRPLPDQPYGVRLRTWTVAHVWLIFWAGALVLGLLLWAVLTT
ncbi:DUF3040 domain-containing protein [Nonomuraea sp. MG754425]|uniref:DUF3040 domain-containing protein n=1 Tax=Nonomuraea sp. MG754425 TaxID=2570319 RepID=UPI001F4499FD|nr:DUF3040 domain-containing protein [Nonomuraea sp. MG754425]MCF6475875.1 DUF3040 domain-containing protein [Nonomuraea sp. MG754425]